MARPKATDKTYAEYLLEDEQRHIVKYGVPPKMPFGVKLLTPKYSKPTVSGVSGLFKAPTLLSRVSSKDR